MLIKIHAIGKLILLILGPLALAACPHHHRVPSYTSVSYVLEHDVDVVCIEKALSSTERVSNVIHRQIPGGRPLTLNGIKPPDTVDSFTYLDELFDGTMQLILTQSWDRRVEVRHLALCSGSKDWTEGALAAESMKGEMEELNQRLAQQCNLNVE